MSYGLQVWNADNRKQIDTDELAPNTYLTTPVSTAYSAMSYPPSGFTTGDLVCARPQSSTGHSVISLGRPISNVQQFFGSQAIQNAGFTFEYSLPSGIVTALVKTQAGIGSPSAGEFGMDVYASNNTLLFSATRSRSVKILATGVVTGGQTFTYTVPSSLTFSNIYAVVNTTLSLAIPAAFVFPSYSFAVQYRFYPHVSTPYIEARNFVFSNGQVVSTWAGGSFSYMLVYDTNI